MAIQASYGSETSYDVTPDQNIGVVVVRNLVIEIAPKIPVASAMFVIAHACELVEWHTELASFGESATTTDMLALMLARAVLGATRRGLLSGYQVVEESLASPRGRIRFDTDCVGIAMSPPVPIRHDEWTADIVENQLLLAAVSKLSRLPVSPAAHSSLSRAKLLFGGVRQLAYQGGNVPSVSITRLNKHYEPALNLATLVLRAMSIDLGKTGPRATAFLVDMNRVFERFVRRALRLELSLSGSTFPDRPTTRFLDDKRRVLLEPDLSLVDKSGRVIWVGDVKYKRLPGRGHINADLYQLLAYCVGHGLSSGSLVYAADAGLREGTYVVNNLGTSIRVRALDLSASIPRLRSQLREIGQELIASSKSTAALAS